MLGKIQVSSDVSLVLTQLRDLRIYDALCAVFLFCFFSVSFASVTC